MDKQGPAPSKRLGVKFLSEPQLHSTFPDKDSLMERIEERGGRLPFTDKAAPLVIQREFGLSKNAFKRAVGRLLKMGKIRLTENSIEKAEKEG